MRIGIFLFSLTWGGATRRIITLAHAFKEKGHDVFFIVVERGGCLDAMASDFKIVELSSRVRKFFLCRRSKKYRIDTSYGLLSKFLEKAYSRGEIDILLSAANHSHLAAINAKLHSNLEVPTVLRLSNHISCSLGNQKNRRKQMRLEAARKHYSKADGFIAVSRNIAADAADVLQISLDRIDVIYNPTFTSDIERKMQEPCSHSWFVDRSRKYKIILGAGRLVPQKNFSLLVEAFALAVKQHDFRLVILGEGKERKKLEALSERLGVRDRLDLPGFVQNPFPYMLGADLFCLSSSFEGLPGVLIEALAVGCPVVSTDCPGGASEILENGQYGALVPPGDVEALATAIIQALEKDWDRKMLKKRASFFSVDNACGAYLASFEKILTGLQ